MNRRSNVSESVIVCFFSSRRRHTRFDCDWSSDVCSSDLLSNAIARYVVIGPEALMREDLERSAHSWPGPDKNEIVPLKSLCREAIRAGEKNIILAALRANRWNRRKAAQELKISYKIGRAH